jgi:hypothetical protein
MYILVPDSNGNDVILLGPTYGTRVFQTSYNDRLNDEEFAKRINEFKPLMF